MSEFAAIAMGAMLAIAYMVAGLGVTRAVAGMKARQIRLFEVFFWPVVLLVIAATGEIAEDA